MNQMYMSSIHSHILFGLATVAGCVSVVAKFNFVENKRIEETNKLKWQLYVKNQQIMEYEKFLDEYKLKDKYLEYFIDIQPKGPMTFQECLPTHGYSN